MVNQYPANKQKPSKKNEKNKDEISQSDFTNRKTVYNLITKKIDSYIKTQDQITRRILTCEEIDKFL